VTAKKKKGVDYCSVSDPSRRRKKRARRVEIMRKTDRIRRGSERRLSRTPDSPGLRGGFLAQNMHISASTAQANTAKAPRLLLIILNKDKNKGKGRFRPAPFLLLILRQSAIFAASGTAAHTIAL
jgi:hypothetical protein